MNQTSVSFDSPLVKTRSLPRNPFVQNAKETLDTPFYKMLQVEKGLSESEQAEVHGYEDSNVTDPYEGTRSFLEQDNLEKVDGAFEFLTKLKMDSPEDMMNIEFVQSLLGSNPSETIKDALHSLERFLELELPFSEMHFTGLPPAREEIETLQTTLNKGVSASLQGLTNEEKKAFMTLLNFGKLIVMSNEHIHSNFQDSEDVNQLAALLSKWKDKLSVVNETRTVQTKEMNRGGSTLIEEGQKLYEPYVAFKSKVGTTVFASMSNQVKSVDLPLHQTVMIGELQWQTNQRSPVLALESSGQTVGADEFIKSFTAILSKANYTNQNGMQRLFIKLAPENLGNLQIELVQKDGQMVAKIIANTQKGKELLESHLQGLKVTLASQGIQFEKIEYKQMNDVHTQGDFSSEERRDRKGDQQDPETDKGHKNEESFSGFSVDLEDFMINQEV